MKPLFWLVLVVAFFISCEKNDSPEESSVYMEATIDGTAWKTTHIEMVGANGRVHGFQSDAGNMEIVLWIFDTIPVHYNFREQAVNDVVLLEYKAGREESDCWLSWRTAQETNSRFFIIEEARGVGTKIPTTWSTVDTVLSAGPGGHDYYYRYGITGADYTHVYFRMAMVDSSNNSFYSKIAGIPTSGVFLKMPGQDFRRGYDGELTITDRTNDYLTGTFSFTVKSLTGELIRVENGRFRCKFKNL